MSEQPAPIDEVRAHLRRIREADARQAREGIATSLSLGAPDREPLLNYVRAQAKLRLSQQKEPLVPRIDENLIKRRVAALARGEFQTREFLIETHGLSERGMAAVEKQINSWSTRTGRTFINGPDRISRWLFERFYAQFRLVSPRWAAARLSMSIELLSEVAKLAVEKLGIPQTEVGDVEVAFREDFLANLHKSFEALRNKVFGDHPGYIRALHNALKGEGMTVRTIYDDTSEVLGDSPLDTCYYVDVVTLRPIGLRYTVWLDFGKPMDLEPDHVGLVAYAQFENLLNASVPEYNQINTGLLELARSVVGK